MRFTKFLVAVALMSSLTMIAGHSSAAPSAAPAVVNRVRFYPASGHEHDMLGASIEGSNTAPTSGYRRLAEIKEVPPPGQWTNLSLDNNQPYRYLRYAAPQGSHCRIAELEFYADKLQLKGPTFGSISNGEAPGGWKLGFDGKTKTSVNCLGSDDQFIGIDLQDLATAKTPVIDPPAGDYQAEQKIKISSRTAGATILYTTDGSRPAVNPRHGQEYTEAISLSHNTTIQALAVPPGADGATELCASPVSSAVYLIGQPTLTFATLHVGNSLTNSTHNLPIYAATLGYKNDYRAFLHGGATTKVLWTDATGLKKEEWEKDLQSFALVNHFTLQPRDFNLDQEADYDMRFLDVVRQKWPDVQPWLYAEWVEFQRKRPTDLGTEKSTQMTKVWSAQSWEESMSAMVLYVEDLQNKIGQLEKTKTFKAPRIIPSALAMGWMRHLIDEGKVPGMPPGSFHQNLFADAVHPNNEGQYLVDLTWLCAFTGKPVVGAVPVDTKLTAQQAKIMQTLAWEVVQNYPAAGCYKVGTKPVSMPRVKVCQRATTGTTYSITSKTDGAWFRYTLDGSEPSRNHGCVYCGTVTVPGDATLRVIAYKNGMSDSKAWAEK